MNNTLIMEMDLLKLGKAKQLGSINQNKYQKQQW